jgi:hypothetical protein
VLTASDLDSASLSYSIETAPGHGVLGILNTNTGAVTYTPAANYNGGDSFTFQTYDGSLYATGTVSIAVTAVNDPPTANNQNVATPEDTATNLVLTASDLDSASLSYSIETAPAHGSLGTLDTNTGTVTYMPATNFNGGDAFTFRAFDGSLYATGTVSLAVTAVNDPPVFPTTSIAKSDAIQDTPYIGETIAGSATDVDAGATLTYAKASGPVWLGVAPDGTLSGTPANSDVGTNTWTMQVSDGIATNAAALKIVVLDVNDAPTFTSDPITKPDATEDSAYAGQTLAGSAADADIGATLTYAKASGPAWLSVAADGAISGTPANPDVGTNTWTVQVSDGIATNTATLKIVVLNVNDAPTFTSDPITKPDATEDSAYAGQTLAGSAIDVDAGATLTYAKASGPAWLSIAGDGALSGTPANGNVGTNAWTVQVSDGIATNTATLNIIVTNAPTLTPPTLTIAPTPPGFVTVSWTPATPGWLLQENLNLGTTNWADYPGGTNSPIVIPTSQTGKFYRLFKP